VVLDVVAVLVVLALVGGLYQIARMLLNDLAQTPDAQLLHLTRQGWAAAILFGGPVGWILYLTTGKLR
jgi:hypothetical protein